MTRFLKRLVPGPVWDRAVRWANRAAYRRAVAAFPRREVEHTYAGHRLRVLLADPTGAEWYDRDWPALPELDPLARHRLRPGGRVFDIGAHQGVVALILARRVGPAGTVVAVEPNPHNTEVAARNAVLNGAGNVTVRRAAGADRPGTVRVGYRSNDRVRPWWDPDAGAAVEAVTVDQLADEYGPPDVVVVDVEGYESFVLTGAARTRAAGRTDWLVEVHVNHGLEAFGGSAEGVLNCFPEPGYERLVASETARDPVPLGAGRGLLTDRFFLIAVARPGGHPI